MSMKRHYSVGQALVEYLLLLLFTVLISVALVGNFQGFLVGTFGNLGHVLSLNLTVGVCPSECFFENYINGYRGQ